MFIKKIAQTCNQPRCSSTDECINKEWYFHSMGYSVIKKNKLSNYDMTSKNLKHILQSKRNQPEKATYIPAI